MCFHNRLDAGEFAGSIAIVALEFDRLQPEFSPLRFPLHVNMRRFMLVARKEEKPIRPGSENGRRHAPAIVPSSA